MCRGWGRGVPRALLWAAIPSVVAALVTDEKRAAGLQHPIDLPEAPGQIRPEIDRLKGGDQIKPPGGKDHIRNAALQHHAAPCQNGLPVDLARFSSVR